MSMPLFFPAPSFVRRLPSSAEYRPLRQWCEAAGVRCKATGAWAERPVRIVRGPPAIIAEASPGTRVTVQAPGASRVSRARYGLGALAYLLMDGVARASIRAAPWARPSPRAGRPPSGRAQNSRERQRLLRSRLVAARKRRNPAG